MPEKNAAILLPSQSETSSDTKLSPSYGIEKHKNELAPIIDAGEKPGSLAAFFRKFGDETPAQKIEAVSTARANGALAFIVEEGTMMGGYTSQKGFDYLKKLGGLSLGLSGPDKAPLLKLGDKPGERQGERTLIGSDPTASAARGRALGEGAWQIIDKPTPTSRRVKHTNIEKYPLEEVHLGNFSKAVPLEVFSPIDLEKVETIHFDKVYAFRIDGNGFVNAMKKAKGTEGQIELIRDYDNFFKKFENRLKEELPEGAAIFGDATTDSDLIYIPNIFTMRRIQEILAEEIQESNISFKAVGKKVENVNLTLIEGRAAISDKPVDESEWAEGEEQIKLELLKYGTDDNRALLESQIRFRDSKRRQQLLRGELKPIIPKKKTV